VVVQVTVWLVEVSVIEVELLSVVLWKEVVLVPDVVVGVVAVVLVMVCGVVVVRTMSTPAHFSSKLPCLQYCSPSISICPPCQPSPYESKQRSRYMAERQQSLSKLASFQ
jgi:hypothetical protein